MAVEVGNVSWLTLVASSAVISALVNVGFTAWVKYGERKREDAKDAKRVGHVYLGIVFSLESFAKQCDERLYDIYNGLAQCEEQHDSSALAKLKPVAFTLDPSSSWDELSIAFVAKVKVLPSQYETTNQWIHQQYEYWAGVDDAYHLEEERLAYYGGKACEMAAEIRRDIKAGDGEVASYVEHFRSIINQRRKAFATDRETALIPELIHQFNKETPP